LAGSDAVVTQRPPQLAVPPAQAHAPLAQVAPPPQTEPQAPQSLAALRRSTQAPAQLVNPAEQAAVHAPELHT